MEEPIHHSFAKARLELATRHEPHKDIIATYRTLDAQRNPHNEPYHNKAPRRSDAQIISDLCFTFADDMLTQQYGSVYTSWLELSCEKDRFNGVYKQKR
jgi:hypothetical protein